MDYERPLPGRRIFAPTAPQVPLGRQPQGSLYDLNDFASEYRDKLVNLVREQVGQWRAQGYSQVTSRVTRDLLDFWFQNEERPDHKKLFFAQREAVETSIWLNEVAHKSNAGVHVLNQLKLANESVDDLASVLPRVGFKMATGTGKTVVMACLLLYHYFNRNEYRNDPRYADYFLIVAPGVTIRDRLSVLRVDTQAERDTDASDYYRQRQLVPPHYQSLLSGLNAKLVITNFHAFEPRQLSGNKRSPLDGKRRADGQKAVALESVHEVVRRVMPSFKPGRRMVVINDEAHHCYLPKAKGKDNDEEQSATENERAAVWFSGLRAFAQRWQMAAVYDLSATPYFLQGSGWPAYSFFPWVVSDFGLIEAIEAGLVKIPFLPVEDSGHSLKEPTLRNLYEFCKDELRHWVEKHEHRDKAEALLAQLLQRVRCVGLDGALPAQASWPEHYGKALAALDRSGTPMAGQVQCIYMDPPYGIKYGSNWQMKLGDRNVKDGADENLSGEPEVIKAFRDTWELGIHSYLSYLRDRLLVAKELLSSSGSCFVQISDENVHLVRSVMDEVFGSENFCSLIAFKKTSGAGSLALGTDVLASTCDYIVWYAKNKEQAKSKFHQLYVEKASGEGEGAYTWLESTDGERQRMTPEEKQSPSTWPAGAKVFRADNLQSQSGVDTTRYPVEFEGRTFVPTKGVWKTSKAGMERLKAARRLILIGNTLSYVRYFQDFPVQSINNFWDDTTVAGFADEKKYVVQTTAKVIQRCILMTTDPGDLVLDPTCGSGTTAHVAEQWGRRWITTDTSRIALNIAKTRLMTATYPWYKLVDVAGQDVRHGFVYKTVPHVTLKSIANGEPPETETLYDQPEPDKKKLRVAGPFTVETLQADEPLAPDQIAAAEEDAEGTQRFIERIFEHLKVAGIKNGAKGETAVFTRVDLINDAAGALHAEGWYDTPAGERKAYFHIGPQFGTVSRVVMNQAVRSCASRGDADWLVLLGFGFDSDVQGGERTRRVGSFQVDKVRMHDDLMQEGLTKKDKKAASFVTIGEPELALRRTGDGKVSVEIVGLDIYDPILDQVKGRSVSDISYWMLDEHYDGSNFTPTQVFFCGGDKGEFDKFKRGLSNLAAASVKKNAERMLKIELDDEAFNRVYGFRSHPVADEKGRVLAVRVISQFGEESTKLLTL